MMTYIDSFTFEVGTGRDPMVVNTLSDATKLRLDSKAARVTLRPDATTYLYPLDTDLNVLTRTFVGSALQALVMVQARATLPDGTSLGFRVRVAGVDYYWSGAAWAVAAAGQWCTEAELNAHAAALDVRVGFALRVNLLTTELGSTPELTSIDFVWKGWESNWEEDTLHDGLMTYLGNLTYGFPLALPPLPVAAASVNLNDYYDESAEAGAPWGGVVDVIEVFNHTDDPNHRTDVLSSYNQATKVVTLTGSAAPGDVLFLRVSATPSMAWDTHGDYSAHEAPRLPQVILTKGATTSVRVSQRSVGVGDTATGVAYFLRKSKSHSVVVSIEMRASRSREQARLHANLARLLETGPPGGTGPFVRNAKTDRLSSISLLGLGVPRQSIGTNIRVEVLTIQVNNMYEAVGEVESGYLVSEFQLGFKTSQSAEEAAAAADERPTRLFAETFTVEEQ